VGVGYLGFHHVRLYSEIEACELVGVYDVDPDKSAAAAKHYGCRSFASVEDLGTCCDAVSVVTPTTSHAEVALSLMDEGCHVLVEKPLCTDLAEARAMIARANEKHLVLQVGHVEHYNPVVTFLEKNVHDPRFITADRLSPFNQRNTDVGVVIDLMIHDLGIVLYLVKSPVESIEAIGVNVLSNGEDIANARLRFQNGCIANFNASRVSLKKTREIRVFQPHKYLSLDFIQQKGHLLFRDNGELRKMDIPLEQREPLRVELESFVECVAYARSPKVDGYAGLSALEIALQITNVLREQDTFRNDV
jgi:predicted dehydrogenase